MVQSENVILLLHNSSLHPSHLYSLGFAGAVLDPSCWPRIYPCPDEIAAGTVDLDILGPIRNSSIEGYNHRLAAVVVVVVDHAGACLGARHISSSKIFRK